MTKKIKPLTITYTLNINEIQQLIEAYQKDDGFFCGDVQSNMIDHAIEMVVEEYHELCEETVQE